MKRSGLILAVVMLLSSVLFGQDVASYPHPYVEAGISINGGGYSSVSEVGAAGVTLEEKHLVVDAFTKYDTAGKTAAGAGHNINYTGVVYFRTTNGWLFGAGSDWAKTFTQEYTKEALHPRAGFGKDFTKVRLTFDYFREENEITHYPVLVQFTPGPGQTKFSYTCHCVSGVNGIETNLWYPSPRSNRHLFFHADLDVYRYHTTITDPYAPWEAPHWHEYSFTGLLSYSILWRF